MWENELKQAIIAGLNAKTTIMKIYNGEFDVEIKEDDSPVTIADKEADKIIREHLSSLFPKHAFLTEESDDDLERLKNDYVWIVDPIDGTKDFIARDGGFTINIALSYKHQIVVGVIIAPATGDIYFASKGNGAFYQQEGKAPVKIHVSDKVEDLTVLCSVFHTSSDELSIITNHADKIKHIVKLGSSLKACYIARGLGEIHFKLKAGPKEWDVAASDIIVTEAGGIFAEPDGQKIRYNREDVHQRKGYIIANRKENILL